MNPFGDCLKRMREQRGLSARQLSLDAGLAAAYVTMAENGDRGKRPSRNSVLALAKAMRLSASEMAELLEAAGLASRVEILGRPSFEEYVNADPLLRSDEKRALIHSYRTYVPRDRR